ncbi:MAG: DUF433 domain-containing protein [Pirellulales bacterium]
MAQAETEKQHIELRANRSGQPRAYIAGTRVRVQDVYAMAELRGQSPDEIVRSLPHLSLAQVYAALAYYFGHRDAILNEVRQDEEFVRHFRAMSGPGPLEVKLKSANGDGDSVPS